MIVYFVKNAHLLTFHFKTISFLKIGRPKINKTNVKEEYANKLESGCNMPVSWFNMPVSGFLCFGSNVLY